MHRLGDIHPGQLWLLHSLPAFSPLAATARVRREEAGKPRPPHSPSGRQCPTGLLLASAFVPVHRGLRTLATAGGTAVVLTALTGYCPLNQALGIDTAHGEDALSGAEDKADTLAPGITRYSASASSFRLLSEALPFLYHLETSAS